MFSIWHHPGPLPAFFLQESCVAYKKIFCRCELQYINWTFFVLIFAVLFCFFVKLLKLLMFCQSYDQNILDGFLRHSVKDRMIK